MAKKVKMSPEEMTDKWQRRSTAAIADTVAGVNRVTESPAQAAIKKKDKMKANLLRSIDDGTWEKNLGKVSLDEWKTKTATKINERMAGGVAAAGDKRVKFDTWLANRLNGLLPKVASMPDLTIEDSINKVAFMMKGMAKDPYKKSA